MNHPTSEGAATKKILSDETPVAQEKSQIRGLHTPEPWDKPEISSGDSGGWKQHSQRIEIWAGEKLIAYYPTDFHEYGTDKENAANAERIVSCVNALAGVQNPVAIKQLIEAARSLVATWDFNTVPKYDYKQGIVDAFAALDSPQKEKEDL